MDAEFVQNACAVNVDLYESLGHIFHTGPFSVWITECTRSALESGKMTPAITALLRKARSLPCGHHKDAKALAAPAPPDSDEEEEEEEESSGSDSGSGAEGSGSDDDDDDDGSDDEGSDSEEEEAAPAPSKKARGSGDAKPAPPAFPPKAAAAPVVPPPRKSKKKNTMAMLPTGYLRSPVCICQLLGPLPSCAFPFTLCLPIQSLSVPSLLFASFFIPFVCLLFPFPFSDSPPFCPSGTISPSSPSLSLLCRRGLPRRVCGCG